LIEKIRKSHDAIVMDTHLDSPCGLEVAKKTRSKKDGPKVVLVIKIPRENIPKNA
jgi:DNA-binding response OmpR family regulator